ncbi:MAG: helix-turn-helix domain-containing protein [Clostridiales bacterium]|nr:helix-turn-helix domain-containing protein [Clostridiales bacterium]
MAFEAFKSAELQKPEVRAEYDSLEPEFSIMQAMIDARLETGMTQKELSERTGISQSEISRYERGAGNPSVRTLRRIAAGLGRSLKIEFEPRKTV